MDGVTTPGVVVTSQILSNGCSHLFDDFHGAQVNALLAAFGVGSGSSIRLTMHQEIPGLSLTYNNSARLSVRGRTRFW